MKLRKVFAIGLSGMMALGLAGCGEKAPDTIKLGLIVPKTGQVAQYGIAVENAANLAVEEINAAGGIDGKQVQLFSYDNKADATESINVFNRLVDNDKIVALVGPVISSTSLAVAPLAEEKKIPMISPTATNLAVTPDYSYVFRACYTDPYQGGTVAKFASENLAAKTAAVLYNAGDDYSTGLAEAFKATFEAAGGTITSYEGYTADDKDFKAVLTTIKEKQPEVLFNPDYYNTVGLIAGQVKEVGLDTIMLGGDGWDDVQKDYADVVDGYFFANHYATDDPDPIVQNFIKAYQDKYEGNTPNALGALGYDATKIMLDAIAKAGSTEGEKILAALQATDTDAVAGHVTFDENGDPQKSVSMIKVEGGALKLEAKIGQ
ncbi:MAG: Amino acid-binding protein [Clostridia bacterium]|jgi:branched-chain amino acid transport system substrate-binding protein|nr:Amino acid-binding protein [Clostridia bacterium]